MPNSDADWDQRVDEAIERAVGFYYEKTKDDFDAVMEALSMLSQRADNMPTMVEFNELKGRVETIEMVVKETNRDLHKLEHAVYNA